MYPIERIVEDDAIIRSHKLGYLIGFDDDDEPVYGDKSDALPLPVSVAIDHIWDMNSEDDPHFMLDAIEQPA